MSGKPSPEGVQLFRVLLKTMSIASKLQDNLMKEISNRKEELETASISYQGARVKLFELMEKMDISENGNFGYEGRMSWFLVELNQQFEQGKPQ